MRCQRKQKNQKQEFLLLGSSVSEDVMNSFNITNPATGTVLDSAPDAGLEEAKAAIDRSVVAFASWLSLIHI